MNNIEFIAICYVDRHFTEGKGQKRESLLPKNKFVPLVPLPKNCEP